MLALSYGEGTEGGFSKIISWDCIIIKYQVLMCGSTKNEHELGCISYCTVGT